MLILGLVVSSNVVCGAEPSVLELETKIPLGNVTGRIDHLAVDRQRLFVAELGNDSVAAIDLKTRTLYKRLTGFTHPQGIGYDAATDSLFIANAGDGSVRIFRAADLAPAGRIDLGDDADNVRVDANANRVYVGYGNGAIAIIDPRKPGKIGDIPLKAHPEGFQLDPANNRIYANVPNAKQVTVLDRASRTQVAAWALPHARANFPMAIDPTGQRVLIVSRDPSKLIAFNPQNGAIVADIPVCGDADDVFIDAKRGRVYVSCGEGFIDIYEQPGAGYRRVGRIATVTGARTALFVPALDRLFLAVRARDGEPAAVWVFRPVP